MNISKASISIIIPIYNCEKYIMQCLESVLNQTFKEFEIICINDGSTDGSAAIIRQYMEKDKRIILLNQDNQGPALARNKGLKIAKGKYIAFLDADDFYLEPDALEKMVILCEEKNLAVCGSFRRNLEPYGYRDTHIIENDQEYALNGTILDYLNFQFDYEYQNFIFLRALIINNAIEFPNYRRYEDPPFLVRALYAAGNFALANTYLYCYRVPNQTQRSDPDSMVDVLAGIINNLQFSIEHELTILFERTVKHIDYERRYLITYDIEKYDIAIVEKLIEATKLIRKYKNDLKYTVNPLGDVLDAFVEKKRGYEDYLIRTLEQNSDVIVFGTGNLSNIFFDFISEKKIMQNVKYVMVTENTSGENQFHGIPIISLNDASTQRDIKDAYILIATTGGHHEEITMRLQEAGLCKIEALNDAFLLDYANRESEA